MALVSYIHNYHFEVIVGYVEEHILEVLKK